MRELVVITPEIERFNEELRSAVSAPFSVLSDMDNGYALMLNLAFYVGDEKKKLMKFAGWNIPPYNANDNWTLPIPATFVVGQDGLVKARHIDPDYRKRMDVGSDPHRDQSVAELSGVGVHAALEAASRRDQSDARIILIRVLAAIDRCRPATA